MLFGGATLLSARPALAKKKKAAEPTQATDEASPPAEQVEKPGKPAEQAGDTEKPKTILDTSQEAPKTDSLGHVHVGSPNAEGLGRVAVKAAPESKIKIFLEGRYFGTAPLTIYSVPKGDYIVEAVYANGKQLSKPVSVGENEETAVDLGGAASLHAASGPGMFDAEMTPTRMTITKVALVVAAVGVVAAVTFGILELKTESDYEKAVGQAQKDDLETKGNHYALATNIGIVAAAVGLVAAGIAGYPLVLRPSEKSKTAFIFTPSATASGGGAAMTVRF
ncbi:MAG TPA: PEGA domain-containing protein [Polyangia bacterium]|jgi:hypothetical protein